MSLTLEDLQDHKKVSWDTFRSVPLGLHEGEELEIRFLLNKAGEHKIGLFDPRRHWWSVCSSTTEEADAVVSFNAILGAVPTPLQRKTITFQSEGDSKPDFEKGEDEVVNYHLTLYGMFVGNLRVGKFQGQVEHYDTILFPESAQDDAAYQMQYGQLVLACYEFVRGLYDAHAAAALSPVGSSPAPTE